MENDLVLLFFFWKKEAEILSVGYPLFCSCKNFQILPEMWWQPVHRSLLADGLCLASGWNLKFVNLVATIHCRWRHENLFVVIMMRPVHWNRIEGDWCHCDRVVWPMGFSIFGHHLAYSMRQPFYYHDAQPHGCDCWPNEIDFVHQCFACRVHRIPESWQLHRLAPNVHALEFRREPVPKKSFSH